MKNANNIEELNNVLKNKNLNKKELSNTGITKRFYNNRGNRRI